MSNSMQQNILKSRVLLVEEDEALSRLIRQPLEQAGLQFSSVSDAASGWQMFQRCQPDLVLLGLGLPRLGGVVLCPQIRAVSTVPIAVLSVRTRKEDHLHALNLGADDFIVVRPLDEQLMMARLLTLLRRVYSYGQASFNAAPNTAKSITAQAPKPTDWATCEACGYMGPQQRFERRNSMGDLTSICPHCNVTECVRFAIA
jgi:DNA-binding response OmpR family regulator